MYIVFMSHAFVPQSMEEVVAICCFLLMVDTHHMNIVFNSNSLGYLDIVTKGNK